MTKHRFGGGWTEDKLLRLEKYLRAYTLIFHKNPQARFFTTTYVDAFAGTGSRYDPRADSKDELPSLFELDDADAESFMRGSARIALECEPGFDRYIFIERNPKYAEELAALKAGFPSKDISIEPMEANSYLQDWCRRTDWRQNRAVVFLDPYGMEVEWGTIESIAETKAIDLWLLFPLGQAVNRMLTTKREPPKGWAEKLTRSFGTDQWREAFYRPSGQLSLLNGPRDLERDADFDSISDFFLDRLDTVFERVSRSPLWLKNSKDIPIYLLCFAAANPRGSATAIKIADHILKH